MKEMDAIKDTKLTKRELESIDMGELINMEKNMGKEDAKEYKIRARNGKGKKQIVDWIHANQNVEQSLTDQKQPVLDTQSKPKPKRKIIVKRKPTPNK
jgi:hypothetical protein